MSERESLTLVPICGSSREERSTGFNHADHLDEIVISVEVTNQAAAGVVPPAPNVDTQQLIVQQCVERVLEILRAREER